MEPVIVQRLEPILEVARQRDEKHPVERNTDRVRGLLDSVGGAYYASKEYSESRSRELRLDRVPGEAYEALVAPVANTETRTAVNPRVVSAALTHPRNEGFVQGMTRVASAAAPDAEHSMLLLLAVVRVQGSTRIQAAADVLGRSDNVNFPSTPEWNSLLLHNPRNGSEAPGLIEYAAASHWATEASYALDSRLQSDSVLPPGARLIAIWNAVQLQTVAPAQLRTTQQGKTSMSQGKSLETLRDHALHYALQGETTKAIIRLGTVMGARPDLLSDSFRDELITLLDPTDIRAVLDDGSHLSGAGISPAP